VRRKRTKLVENSEEVCQWRLVPNTDISSVRHQMWTEDSIGAASARDLNPLIRTINTSQNHNSVITGIIKPIIIRAGTNIIGIVGIGLRKAMTRK